MYTIFTGARLKVRSLKLIWKGLKWLNTNILNEIMAYCEYKGEWSKGKMKLQGKMRMKVWKKVWLWKKKLKRNEKFNEARDNGLEMNPTKVIENETKWNWQNQTKWKRQNKTMKMTKQKSQLEMKCNGKLKLKQEDTKRSPMKAQEKWIRRAKMNPRYFCIINEIWPRKEIKNEY